MRLLSLSLLLRIALLFTPPCHSNPISKDERAASRNMITPNILPLTSIPRPSNLTPPQTYTRFKTTNLADRPDALTTHTSPLLTLAGRVYMTTITLGSSPYTLVIDTGSSDTWIASSSFTCQHRLTHLSLPLSRCNLGKLYTPTPSFVSAPGANFSVAYTDGEFLTGELGSEMLGVAGLKARQVVGVVERGWWIGDGRSSGLMGLGYSGLVDGGLEAGYSSVVFSIFANNTVPHVFSLALSRASETEESGGVLALGGIPAIPHDDTFVATPIVPLLPGLYAWYAISIDGFSISAPQDPRKRSDDDQQERFRGATEFAIQPTKVIIDSGTTLMYLPDKLVDYIASTFSPPAFVNPFNGLYMADCGAKAPRFGVIIAGKTLFVNSVDLLNPMGPDLCMLTIQRQRGGDAVLGDSFLKNVLAVFDVGIHEMRFAAREVY